MDPASQTALAFIEGVQAARRELGAVRQHFSKRGLEVFGDSLCFGPIWGDDRLYFGIMVQGTDGRNYELLVCLHWTTSEWTIETDASIEEEDEDGMVTYPRLRGLPDQRSAELGICMEQLKTAVANLVRFEDLIPVKAR